MRVLFSLPSPTVFHRAQSVGLEEDTDSCVSGASPGFDGRRHGSDFVPSLPEHMGKTRGIRLRQWGGGPQQTQAPLTHLNAATRWQQKNKGRLEQSTHFFLLLCFFLKSSRCGWVMWCDVNTYFFCCLTGLTRAQLDCVLGSNLWDYSDLDNLRLHRHISSCSKCHDVKKTKQKTLWRHCVIFLPGPIFSKHLLNFLLFYCCRKFWEFGIHFFFLNTDAGDTTWAREKQQRADGWRASMQWAAPKASCATAKGA